MKRSSLDFVSCLRSLAGAACVAGLLAAGCGGRAAADDDVIARGKYLADMGDCAGCHNAPGGGYLAGGQYMNMPFGNISTPNITADKQTGIGNWTDDEYLNLMRHGVMPNGQRIYPAMPYPWYNTVSRDDLLAIKAYLFSLPRVYAPRQPNKIWFPFTIRPAIALWDAFFVPGAYFKPNPKQSDEINRGDYIVNGLEHCGTCHNNRNLLGNTSLALSVEGGAITMWYAPSLRPDKMTGIGGFSDDDVVQYLKTGHSPQMGTVAGPMSETVEYSLSKLTDPDLHAIVAYLKSLPAVASYQPHTAAWSPARYANGQAVYLAHCASCHQNNGQGITNRIPALDGNGMVRALGPQSVIRVVLGGLEAHGPYAVMPGVGSQMSDREIADVSNYIRQSWSNQAPGNATIGLVGLLRDDTSTLLNGKRPQGCPDVSQPELKRVLADQSSGIETLLSDTHPTNLLQSVNALIGKVKAAVPSMEQADIVNGLTQAYCPIVQNDASVPADARVWQLTHFADRLYVQLTTGGKY